MAAAVAAHEDEVVLAVVEEVIAADSREAVEEEDLEEVQTAEEAVSEAVEVEVGVVLLPSGFMGKSHAFILS
jgi:hypothetical protein